MGLDPEVPLRLPRSDLAEEPRPPAAGPAKFSEELAKQEEPRFDVEYAPPSLREPRRDLLPIGPERSVVERSGKDDHGFRIPGTHRHAAERSGLTR